MSQATHKIRVKTHALYCHQSWLCCKSLCFVHSIDKVHVMYRVTALENELTPIASQNQFCPHFPQKSLYQCESAPKVRWKEPSQRVDSFIQMTHQYKTKWAVSLVQQNFCEPIRFHTAQFSQKNPIRSRCVFKPWDSWSPMNFKASLVWVCK